MDLIITTFGNINTKDESILNAKLKKDAQLLFTSHGQCIHLDTGKCLTTNDDIMNLGSVFLRQLDDGFVKDKKKVKIVKGLLFEQKKNNNIEDEKLIPEKIKQLAITDNALCLFLLQNYSFSASGLAKYKNIERFQARVIVEDLIKNKIVQKEHTHFRLLADARTFLREMERTKLLKKLDNTQRTENSIPNKMPILDQVKMISDTPRSEVVKKKKKK